MRTRFLVAAAALAFAAPLSAAAQDGGDDFSYELAQADDARARAIERERAEIAQDDVRAQVYSPEFVLENRREIGLSDQQRREIVAELQRLQGGLVNMQMDMQDARDDLIAALRARPAEEADVLAALDRVLDIERGVKRAQIRALVRLRDMLTPAQRARLDALRRG